MVSLTRLVTIVGLVVVVVASGCLRGDRGGSRSGSGSGSGSGPAALHLEPCQLAAPGSSTRLAARCGTWRVPEDRSHLDGRKIDLRVAVIPALSREPAPDPLAFLTGGPGQAATESYVTLAPAFRKISKERDILLVDQRGTGGSNALRCPETDASDLMLLEEKEVKPWVERCLASLDADPRFYTTSIAMQDLDEVRAALAYPKIDLYGLSYGTRAALTYLRMFPERVRAVILDGVVPPTAVLGLDVAKDAQRALDILIERCRVDPTCAKEFPDLESDLDRLMERLRAPVEVDLRHPRSGEQRTLRLTRDMAAYAIRILSYAQETQSLIPVLLHSAASFDLAPLAAQFLMTTTQVGETMADGMGLSVVCSEDYPFFEETAIEQRNRDTYLGATQTDSLKLVCPLWPRGVIPENFKSPVHSDVPVLLLSGEADPVTPPENGSITRAQLGNGLHLVAKGQGHVVIHRGCIPALAAAFIEAGSFEGLSTGCVSEIAPQAFFIHFLGPSP